jgi:RND family efflux transporter MFP subunit
MKAQIEQAKSELAVNKENIKTLKESLNYWKKELERNKNLRLSGSISISKVDATTEKLNQVRGQLRSVEEKSNSILRKIDGLKRKGDELRTTLSYCTIRSPFDGVITIKKIDIGDLASPGKILLVVENRNILKLSFDVPQYDLPSLKKDMIVKYMKNNIEKTSKISRLYPSLNSARMARVEALLECCDLTLGAFVDVSVVFNKLENVTMIPIDSIIEMGNGVSKTFIVDNGKLVSKDIEILATSDKMAAVSGVKEGQNVVRNSFLGWARLHDGMNVEVF